MRRFALASATLASLVAAAPALALAEPPAPGTGPDYTTLPPEPAEVQKQLEGAKVSMAQAVAAAEKEMNGACLAGRAIVANGAVTSYEVIVTCGGLQKRVSVDAASGKVTGATVTIAGAVAKATEKLKGGVVREA